MLTPGARSTFTAMTVTKVGYYQRPLRDGSGEETKWRYAFVKDDGGRYVYTGRHYNLEVGQTVTLIATVKRLEPEYRQVRLCRLRIIRDDGQGKLL